MNKTSVLKELMFMVDNIKAVTMTMGSGQIILCHVETLKWRA